MLATGVTSSRNRPPSSSSSPPISTSNIEEKLQRQIERLERQLLETQKRGDLTEESRLCNNIAKKYEGIGEWKRSLQFHHYDRQISEVAGDMEGYIIAVNNMAESCHSLGVSELALTFLRQSLDMALKIQDMPQAFRSQLSMGKIFLERAELIDFGVIKKDLLLDAKISLNKSQEYLDNYETIIEAGLLSSNRRKELISLRIDADLQEIELYLSEEIKDFGYCHIKLDNIMSQVRNLKDKLKEFEVFGLKGRVFCEEKKYQEAIESCFDNQLQMAKSLDDQNLQSEVLLNLAESYKGLRDFDLALSTMYLYKDHLKLRSINVNVIEDVDERIQELIEMQESCKKVKLLERRYGRNPDGAKENLEIAIELRRISLPEEAFEYACEAFKVSDSLNNRRYLLKSCKLAAELALFDLSDAESAVEYSQKYHHLIGRINDENDDREGHDGDDKLFVAYMLLIDSYLLNPEWTSDAAITLLESQKYITNQEHELQWLDRSSSINLLLGNDQKYSEYKQKCWELYRQLYLGEEDLKVKKLNQDLKEMDYFVNRKPSKTVMKLVDGQFNMTSRIKGGGTKGLEIKRSRIKDERLNPQKRKSTKRITIEDDLDGFIVDDELDHDDDCNTVSLPKNRSSKKRSSLIDDYSTIDLSVDYDDIDTKLYNQNDLDLRRDEKSKLTLSKKLRNHSIDDPGFIAAILRVNININEKSLMIPIVDDIAERKTILWLTKEIKERYKSAFGETPIIDSLLTEEGSLLHSADLASLTLNDGQRLIANISGFLGKSINVLYSEGCQEKGIRPLDNFIKITEQGHLNLSHSYVPFDHLQIMMEKLFFNPSERITQLSMSSNLIYDFHRIPSQTNLLLEKLDLSFTPISKVSWIPNCFPNLKSLSVSFCSNIMDFDALIYSLSRKGQGLVDLDLSGCELNDLSDLHFLPNLQELNLSFGRFYFDGLEQLLVKTSSLRKLNLSGCDLPNDIMGRLFKALSINCTLNEIIIIGNPGLLQPNSPLSNNNLQRTKLNIISDF